MLVLTTIYNKETDLNESRKSKELFRKKDEIISIKENWLNGVMGTEAKFQGRRVPCQYQVLINTFVLEIEVTGMCCSLKE